MTVYGMWALFAALAAAAGLPPWIGVRGIHGLRHARPRFSLRLPAAPLLSTQRIIGAAVLVGCCSTRRRRSV